MTSFTIMMMVTSSLSQLMNNTQFRDLFLFYGCTFEVLTFVVLEKSHSEVRERVRHTESVRETDRHTGRSHKLKKNKLLGAAN